MIFVPFILVKFLVWIKKTGWREISEKYPLPRDRYAEINTILKYGRANIGGIYSRNSVFSAITVEGVFVRKPFPFNLLMPPIFIPWDRIDSVVITKRLHGNQRSANFKFIDKIAFSKYADIQVKNFINHMFIIPWKEIYRESVPAGKIDAEGRGRSEEIK